MNQSQHPMQQVSHENVDMRSLVEVLIRRRWVILLVSVPVILVATLATLRSSQIFTARSTLMIEIGGPQNPRFSERRDLNTVLSSAAELGASAPVARLAAESLADSIPSLQARYPQWFEGVESVEDLAGIIHDGVNSGHIGESNLLSLSFSHPAAGFALTGAGAVARAFIDFNISTKRNSPAVEYYTEQIMSAQAEIDSLYALRTAALDKAGVLGMAADLRMTVSQIRNLESEYFRARTARVGLEAEIDMLEQAIAADPEFLPPGLNRGTTSASRLKSALDESLARLAELRQRYAEDSVWVQRELTQVQALRIELLRERDQYMASLKVELGELKAVEASYEEAHQQQLAGIQSYPEMQANLESLDMQIGGLRDVLGSLQRKRGEVRMAADSDIRVTDAIIIEEPTLDTPVGKGRKILYLLVAVVLAVAIGLVVAFFVESNDHRIYDRRRAELYLEVPVLGSLPDTSRKPQA